jgi:hypothetical protein
VEKSRPSGSRKTLPTTLKDDVARMNDRNRLKLTVQLNDQTADSKFNASAFNFTPYTFVNNLSQA